MTTPLGTGPDADVRRRRLLGTGLRADPVGTADLARDVVLAGTAGGVDLAVVTGLDALAQDLAVGLATLRGTDVFNTGFGFLGLGPLTEATSPAIARETLRGAVAQLVAADPRVRRIVDITATPAGRALDITVTFEAISGDTATVAVSGLASGGTFGLETQA